MDPYLLAKISTLFIFIPIAFGTWANIIKAEVYLRLFLFFLIIGFAVDGLSWYQHTLYLDVQDGLMDRALYDRLFVPFDLIRRIYGLLEALFFLGFVAYLSPIKLKSIIIRVVIPSTIFVWCLLEICIPYEFFGLSKELLTDESGVSEISYYQAYYRVLVTFLAGFALLKLQEHHLLSLRKGMHWFLMAIFAYSMTTFFVMILQRDKELAEALWFLHNTFNMMSYLLYAWAFYKGVKTA